MQYYFIKTLGKSRTDKFCMTDGMPKGIEGDKSALEYGGTLKSVYPGDPLEVTMKLDEDKPKHIKLGSFISTTSKYIMISSEVIEALKKFNIGEVEFWSFTLLNHKDRVHSQDYSFVCPVHQYDAINEDLSEFRRDSNGIPLRIKKVVLDEAKLKNAPDMFRVNDIRYMAFSEPLAQALQEKFTNFVFEKAEQV